MTKFCSMCKEEKSVSDFWRNRSHKDGLQRECRDCLREMQRKYKEENREKVLEMQRKYREENRDYYTSKSREYRRKKNKVSASMATKSGRWSQEEVDLLIELRKTRTVYQCAIELGRKYGSTQEKIALLRKKGVEI